MCQGPADLGKRVIVDVWDWDVGGRGDFMGHVEASLRELLDAAASGAALPLLAPPPPHKQECGRLYVERAVLGFPEVRRPARRPATRRAASTWASSRGAL